MKQKKDIIKTDQRMLFIDDRYIKDSNGLIRRLHSFIKEPEPVIVPEHPWEHNCVIAWGSAVYDPGYNCFRLWYEAYDKFLPSTLLCYAESKDLINWSKPDLGIHSYKDNKNTNIVLNMPSRFDSASIVIDQDSVRTRDKYKMLFCQYGSASGIYSAVSADGFDWKVGRKPISDTGDRHCLMKDELKKRYLVTTKPRPAVPRKIAVFESNDFRDWTKDKTVLESDKNDPPQTELYGMTPFLYEGIYLGFLEVFNIPERRLDTELVASTDGYDWQRVCQNQKNLETGKLGDWDYSWVFPSFNPPLHYGEELFVLFSGRNTLHWAEPPFGHIGRIGLAKMRRDGFVSLNANAKGELTTKPFVLDGKVLCINADAAKGDIKIELLDKEGHVLNGYSKDECNPVVKNLTYQKITWKDKSDLTELKGSGISVRLYLNKADIYSLWISSGEY